jgi:flagellar L-ring protein precursor FlgH
MKRHMIPVAIAGAMLAVQSPSNADSLWQRRSRHRAFMFYDQPIYDVGDHLTILINQNTIIDNNEEKKLSKQAKVSESFDFDSQTGGGLNEQGASASLELSNDAKRSFDAEAESTIDNRFTDRVTVAVREVLPNGNLRVSGDRKILVDGNQRHLLISGVVRQLDIAPNGTIGSDFVGQLNVQYVGLGEHQAFMRQGWMGRAFNRIWPF